MRVITSALYVDFDNVYLNLAQFDRATAEAFATDPGRLLTVLHRGVDEEGPFRRRFLVRDCYLNPQSFAIYRAHFVAAGFRVIDCPSLTSRGKSAADTHIVIDVVDAISHATRYDEFVICSADADFSPLMTKLRRHDRRTVMVTAGNAAPAYQAVCDTTLGAMELVKAFTPDELAAEDEGERIEAHPTVDHEAVELAAAAVLACVEASALPVPGPTAAGAALKAVPTIAQSKWGGTGGFAAFVQEHLPALKFVSMAGGGRLLDPTRHTVAETPAVEEPDDVTTQVSRVTKVPLLTSAQYAVLFHELATVARVQPRLGRIGSDVRERAADTAAPVPRKSVDFVVTGLVYAGFDPRTADLDARGLATRWLDNVYYRCDDAGLTLDEDDRKAIADWITGGLPAYQT